MPDSNQNSSLPIFDRMALLVEELGPKEGWLAAYPDDFWRHDRNYLSLTASPGAEYLWVIRDTGTHLVRLGVHPKETEWAEAALSMESFLAAYRFRLDDALDGRLQRVGHAQAENSIKLVGWKVDVSAATGSGPIFCPGRSEPAACLDATTVRYENSTFVDLAFSSERSPDRVLLTALWIIARSEVVRAGRTLFARTGEITLNGEPLFDQLSACVGLPVSEAA